MISPFAPINLPTLNKEEINMNYEGAESEGDKKSYSNTDNLDYSEPVKKHQKTAVDLKEGLSIENTNEQYANQNKGSTAMN